MANRLKNIAIEDAQICFRNFSGKEGKFNAEGVRNFCVILDDHIADQLLSDGWNVKYLNPREDGEAPRPYIQVAVSYRNFPPKIAMVSSKGISLLDEGSVGMLDWAELSTVDLILSPYRWDVNGKTGIKAYLKTMYATIAEDEFESKYYATPDSAQGAIGGCGRCEECDGHCGGGL